LRLKLDIEILYKIHLNNNALTGEKGNHPCHRIGGVAREPENGTALDNGGDTRKAGKPGDVGDTVGIGATLFLDGTFWGNTG